MNILKYELKPAKCNDEAKIVTASWPKRLRLLIKKISHLCTGLKSSIRIYQEIVEPKMHVKFYLCPKTYHISFSILPVQNNSLVQIYSTLEWLSYTYPKKTRERGEGENRRFPPSMT